MKQKQKLGQFFTTNSDYILAGFEYLVNGKDILDPFAGKCDLLNWASKNAAASVSGLDIDEQLVDDKSIRLNDSLVSIPKSDFIITNPPYLAKNKMDVAQKAKYMTNGDHDFYLLAMRRILESDTSEGIIIIPVNFFSAENSAALRKSFIDVYDIGQIRHFEHQVFDDTTYNVVAFHFIKAKSSSTTKLLHWKCIPSNTERAFTVSSQYGYSIAGDALDEISKAKPLKCTRLTEDHMQKNDGDQPISAFFNDKHTTIEYKVNSSLYGSIKNNMLLLNAIDTNSKEDGWISLEDIRQYNVDCLVGKISSRNIAYILLDNISLDRQEAIITLFNETLNTLRKEYSSLFLTNFRDNNRKRASFEFCYQLISYCNHLIESRNISCQE